MGITFSEGQPVELQLPGGKFKGTIVGAGQYPGDWIVHIEDSDNPLSETKKGALDE